MARLQRKALGTPEEVRRFPLGFMEIVSLDEAVFAHAVFQPGWHWAEHLKGIVGTTWCQNRHVGMQGRGQVHGFIR